MLKASYSIPLRFKSDVESLVKRIAKKAKAFGDVALTFSEPYEIEVETSGFWYDPKIWISYVDFEVTYPDMTVGDYEVVGVAEVLDGANLLYGIEELSAYRYVKLTCEHCNTNRMRKKYTFVRHVETRQISCIGTSCLGEYLDYNPTVAIAMMLKWRQINELAAAKLNDWWDEEDGQVKPEHLTFDAERLITLTVQCVELFGFTSKAQARETGSYATGDLVKTILVSKKKPDGIELPTADHVARAREIIERWKAIDSYNCNEFNYKKYVAGTKGLVSWNLINTIVAAAAIERIGDEAEDDGPKIVKEYFGSEEHVQLHTLTITLSEVKRPDYSSDYVLVKGYNSEMKEFVYMGHSKFAETAAVGRTYTVKAKIRHDNHHHWGKSNRLVRPSIVA